MAFIGIDLGTTNSLVALKRPGRELKIYNIREILEETPIEEAIRKYLPSAVSFMEGEYLSGWDVVDNPEQEGRIFSIKRLMGRGFDDSDPKRDFLIREKVLETWGYILREPLEGSGEDIEVRVGDDWLTPQEISSKILMKLKQIVKKQEENETVDGAVITVPAYFNDKQKWATREAARLAGLDVQMILDEPTAAAVAYGMERIGGEPQTVLVYDLGGGTFDVSLLEITGTRFETLAIDGNNWLGGDDFDEEIVKYVLDSVEDTYADVLKNDQIKRNILKQRAKEAKETLSSSLDAPIRLEEHRDICIARGDFEQLITPYIDETLDLVQSVLKENSMSEEEIDKVLLVGGSTKIPLVRTRLVEKFGEAKIATEIDPMLCVTMGAAIKSSLLLNRWECPRCGEITENAICGKGHPKPQTIPSTERPYGVGIYDEKRGRLIFDALIPEYTPYPLKKPKKRLYGIQEKDARVLKVPFYAGEKTNGKSYHEDLEKNSHLGTIWMVLPKGLSKKDKVEILFNVGNDGILDLENISIAIGGKPVEKKAVIRDSEDENTAKEIETLMNILPKRISDTKEGEIRLEKACEILGDLFERDRILDRQEKEKAMERIKNKIKQIEQVPRDDDEPNVSPVIMAARNIILFSYDVEAEYGWLPFMQDESRRGEIKIVREALEKTIEGEKTIKVEDEWEIMRLTRRLRALLSDNALDFLLLIETAARIAEKGKRADISKKRISYLKQVIDQLGPSETPFERKGVSERKEDSEKLMAAKKKIEMLLKQRRVKEAEEEYLKITDLVTYYLTESSRS